MIIERWILIAQINLFMMKCTLIVNNDTHIIVVNVINDLLAEVI